MIKIEFDLIGELGGGVPVQFYCIKEGGTDSLIRHLVIQYDFLWGITREVDESIKEGGTHPLIKHPVIKYDFIWGLI